MLIEGNLGTVMLQLNAQAFINFYDILGGEGLFEGAFKIAFKMLSILKSLPYLWSPSFHCLKLKAIYPISWNQSMKG